MIFYHVIFIYFLPPPVFFDKDFLFMSPGNVRALSTFFCLWTPPSACSCFYFSFFSLYYPSSRYLSTLANLYLISTLHSALEVIGLLNSIYNRPLTDFLHFFTFRSPISLTIPCPTASKTLLTPIYHPVTPPIRLILFVSRLLRRCLLHPATSCDPWMPLLLVHSGL